MISATQRSRLYEETFTRAANAIQDNVAEQAAEFGSAQVFRDRSRRHTPVSALLLMETVHWQQLGERIGYFAGNSPLRAIVDEPGVRRDYLRLFRGTGDFVLPHEMGFTRFQDALVSAVEDLRPERLELVHTLVVATEGEREARLNALEGFVRSVEVNLSRRAVYGELFRWALDGRDSSIDGWAGPAAWRTNAALSSREGYPTLSTLGARLARATLTRALGNEYRDEVYAEVARQTGEAGEASTFT